NISYYLAASYSLNDNKAKSVSYSYTTNKFFLQLPADATSMSVVLRMSYPNIENFPSGIIYKKWKFDTVEARRELTIDIPAATAPVIKIVDVNGKAIADNVKITGKMICNLQKDIKDDDWLKETLAYYTISMAGREKEGFVNIQAVVKDGCITLPNCMPGLSYRLQLNTDAITGTITDISIDGAGKADIDSYVLLKRTVVQTVFNTAGNVAANATVNASYIQDGIVKITTGKTDAKGIVNWDNLPPVRVTVWGDDIPAGVIPADAKVITAALAPPENRTVPVIIKSKVGTLNGIITSSTLVNNNEIIANTQTCVSETQYSIKTDKLTSFYLMTADDNPQVKGIKLYIPYNDYSSQDQGFISTLEINDVVPMYSAKIKVVNSDGVTPAQVNKAGVISTVIPKELLDKNDNLVDLNVSDGKIIIKSIMPGNYKLLIDALYDTDNYAAMITLPAKDEITVIMPDSKASLPAGATVYWTDLSNPMQIHNMTLGLENDVRTFYYNAKNTFAWWCKTSPSTMQVWKNNELKKWDLRSFTVKNAAETFAWQIANDLNYFGENQLLPLFPPIGNNIFEKDIAPGIIYNSKVINKIPD
ncbi:MAG: hypothetical protein WCO98_17160, partial [bacterium]